MGHIGDRLGPPGSNGRCTIMIRVAIADDHPLVRDGIAAILTRDEEIEVVLEASSGPELVGLLARHSPDVVLCDLRMPGGDGVEAIRPRGVRCSALPRCVPSPALTRQRNG